MFELLTCSAVMHSKTDQFHLGDSSVEERLTSLHKALGSIPNITMTNKQINKQTGNPNIADPCLRLHLVPTMSPTDDLQSGQHINVS